MEINQLIYFLEVAKQKSFTGAAKTLHVSQPAISKMIRMLEDELGVILFDRSSRHVQLTDYGTIVQNQVQKLVQTFQDIHTELDEVTLLQKGVLRIGIPPMVGEMFFPRIIGLFHQQYPNIKIKLFEVGSKKVEDGVEDGSLDVGVAVLPIKPDTFEAYEFAKNPIMLVVDSQHRLAGRTAAKFSDLKDESFILYRQDFGLYQMIVNACNLAGFDPDIVCETSQWDFMARIVADGLGIALLPKRVCQELKNSNVKVIPLDSPQIYWHLALIWRQHAYQSQATQKWIAFAKSQFTETAISQDFWTKAVFP
ncbi:MAG: LysR family transcriptional regulator [Negativicutes bacterium]|nr:LysR family transcriptional regulator [Negativicutes bacterium]